MQELQLHILPEVLYSLHYITLQYSTVHYITLHYITLHYTTSCYIVLHYISLHYTTLHYTTLHYTTIHYTTTIHYITLNVTIFTKTVRKSIIAYAWKYLFKHKDATGIKKKKHILLEDQASNWLQIWTTASSLNV